MDISEQNRLFYNDGYLMGQRVATKNTKEKISLQQAVKAMYKSIDQLIDSFLKFSENHKVKPDCKKGCGYCCHQPVFANSYEIEYLGNYIRENFTESQQQEILKRAKEKTNKTGHLSKKELQNFKFPCPLLRNNICIAYPARPLACRIYLSTQLSSCIHFFEDPKDEKEYPQLLDFPLRTGRLMNQGLYQALKENGISAHEYKLEEGLGGYLENIKLN